MASNQYANKIIKGNEVVIDLTGDTVEASKLAEGYTAHGPDGAPIVGTNTFDSDTSEDDALVSEILYGKTAHVRGTQLIGAMPNRGGVVGTISTTSGSYAIPQGYHDGSGSVAIDAVEQAKLIPENIKEGTTILGVIGTHSGAGPVTTQAKSATPSFQQQSVLPDQGYDYLSEVTVAAIPWVETDNAAGGKTITIG